MNETILLVDDNPSNLALLFDHLDKIGYHILVTDNGIDAIEQSAESPPDLILLDVRMPGMNGYETCRAIKANVESADVPVLFLSALDDTDDRLRGFLAGGVDYITKPIQVEEVTARVQTHLKLARLQKELSQTNEQLEATISERTSELNAEIERRKQQETEKESLLRLLRDQNQQLYQFTNHLLQARPAAQVMLSQIISEQLMNNLAAISAELHASTKQFVKLSISNGKAFDHLQSARLHTEQLQNYLRAIVANDATAQSALPDLTPLPVEDLTPRELDILRLLADGFSAGEISNQLQISEVTVRSYRTRIMRKLQIPHLAGLVKFALKYNLTTFQT